MTRFRKRNRIIHGLTIADLANQNHIWRLAQRIFKCDVPAISIDANFALGNDAIVMLMHKLYWVFNGNNMAKTVFVAVAHHRRQRRRLTRTGATDENHQAALGHRNVF